MTAAAPEGLQRITQSQHIDVLNAPDMRGRYWYDTGDITDDRPYVAIDKTGADFRSETFATKEEMLSWFGMGDAAEKQQGGDGIAQTTEPAASSNIPTKPVQIEKLYLGENDVYGQQRAAAQKRLSEVLDSLAVRMDVSVARDEIPEFPADIVKQLTAEKITKPDVENILAVFRGHISIPQIQAQARSIVVTSEADKDGMKKAGELRRAVKQLRLRLIDLISLDKDEHHRRWQVYTGVIRIVRDLFENEEKYLLEQEEFAKRREAERKAELRTKRLEQLAAVEFENPQNLDLAEYSDEAFDAILRTATEAYATKQEMARREEEDRIARERRQERRAARIRQLSMLGLTYDGVGSYGYHGLITIPESTVDDATDEVFTAAVENAKPIIEHEKFLDQRLKQRSQELYALGLRPSAAGGTVVYGENEYTLELKDARNLSDDDWLVKITSARMHVNALKEQAAEAKATAERVAREAAEKAEAARQLALAPEKERLSKWAEKIVEFSKTAAPQADMSPEANEILTASLSHLVKVAERIRERVSSL